jgi:hypothetical protein
LRRRHHRQRRRIFLLVYRRNIQPLPAIIFSRMAKMDDRVKRSDLAGSEIHL